MSRIAPDPAVVVVAAPPPAGASSGARRRVLAGHGAGEWAALAVLLLIALVALLGPLLVTTDPNSISLSQAYGAPVAEHPLGFDGQGRDLLARLVHGAHTAIVGPLLVVAVSTVLGTALALVAAWRGGWIDTVVARFVDAMFAFPGLLLAILVVALFGAGLTAAGIALAIAYTPYVARIVRSAALRERSLPYVAALTVQGSPAFTINLRHIVPNLGGLIVATATLSYGYALIDLAALSFIGLGVQPPTADWGIMIANGVPGILAGYPQESLYASALIVLTVGAVNYVGDRLTSGAAARG